MIPPGWTVFPGFRFGVKYRSLEVLDDFSSWN
jgi:hypothetical protein